MQSSTYPNSIYNTKILNQNQVKNMIRINKRKKHIQETYYTSELAMRKAKQGNVARIT